MPAIGPCRHPHIVTYPSELHAPIVDLLAHYLPRRERSDTEILRQMRGGGVKIVVGRPTISYSSVSPVLRTYSGLAATKRPSLSLAKK